MFQDSNVVDDAKSEWNINETHIIIPMIDGDVINKESDKILTSSLNLNSLEAGDQAMLNTALEHSFVIGFDKNLDTPNFKSDFVIIQNSDFKLLSCNNDLKNSVAYALSYADQDKNEILWQSSVMKDGIYPNNKPILEVRDEIDYKDSVHDVEKNEKINLVNVGSDIAIQVPKTNEEIINENKNEKSHFIDYLTLAQNNEINLEYEDSSKLNKESRSIDKRYLKNVKNKLEENLCKDTETVQECNQSEPSILVEQLKYKTEEKEIIVSSNYKNTKDLKLEGMEIFRSASDSLPEKSLPLKKKAKMKRTLTLYNSENQRSLLKQDLVAANQHKDIKSITGRKTKQSNPDKEQNQSQINMSLISKVTKQRKPTKLKNSSKNAQKSFYNSEVNENSSPTIEYFGFNKDKFCNIYDLVECLRKCKMINAPIWQTLNIGLKEMNVDILKEMNAKKNKKQEKAESINYSPQLKAFALVLYFKQPAAFNYLSQVYDTGWPSIKTIKDWKRKINSYHRHKIEKDTDLSS